MPQRDTFDHASCAGCELPTRRTFIQSMVAGVAVLVGLASPLNAEMPQFVDALSLPDSATDTEVKYAIPAADGVAIDTKNDVIIARSAGKAYAFALSCPHQNTELRWNAKDRRFQCPKHKSRYTATGEFMDGRATRNMDRLPIRLDGATLVVDVSREIRSDEEAAKWASAVVVVPA